MKLRRLAPLVVLALSLACALVPPPPEPTRTVAPSLVTQPAALASPTYPVTPPASATFAPTTAPISGLGLAGKLIYTQGLKGLWQMDLSTGAQTQMWQIPERAFLAGVAASPDGSRLALSYSPPPPEGTPQLGVTDLYLAKGDGSDVQLALEGSVEFESYINPTWSPDGQWLYFTHYQPVYDEKGTFSGLILNIEKMPAAGGPPEIVIEGAQQGYLSGDGARLVYLRFDLETYATGLWVANADGSEATELLPDSAFFSLVGPHLSADGSQIVFGASGPLMAAASAPGVSVAGLLAEWFGAKTAEAHGPPWEVWQIAAEDGPPEQLTQLFTDGPWPVWSPDGAQLAVLQPGGVLLLGEGDPVFLGPAEGHGEMVWIP